MGMTIERAQSIIQAAHRNIAYFQEVNKQEKTEMSIDKSITLLTDYLERQKLHEMDETGVDEATRNLIDVAKKYQKIQEIVKQKDGITDECLCERMKYRQGDPLYIPNSKGNYNYFYIKYCPVCGKLLPKG